MSGQAINPSGVKSVLIINLGGIGDLLFSLPALSALRAHFKEAKFALLAVARTAEVAGDLRYFDEIIILDLRAHKALPLLLKLGKRRFDLAVNMRSIASWGGAFKMAAILFLIRPRLKAGRDTAGKGFFFDIKIPEPRIGAVPEYEYDLKTAASLGANARFSAPEISPGAADISYVNNFLSSNGIREGDILVGINPGSPHRAKRWGAHNFAKVADILSAQANCKIIITGSSEEEAIAHELQGLSKAALLNAAGKTSFLQLAHLLRRCSCFVTNDTGVMHLAALLGVPLVAIFAGGYLSRFDPRHICKEAIVIRGCVECAPCDKVTCGSMKCLKAISAKAVAQAALKILQSKAKGGMPGVQQNL